MFRLCSLLVLLAAPALSAEFTGPIRVVDADTFDIGWRENIRLIGIDAAEDAQTCTNADGAVLACGQFATEAARALYQGRQATCRWDQTDRYGRPLAVCEVGGTDANAELVRLGIARVYRQDRTYFEEQKEAVLLSRGLWAYDMIDPAAYRAEQRAMRARANAPDGACTIKGNISGNGRIYHLPGSPAYGPTRIDERRGERWFCTEDEARAAGWRPAIF
jgi:endonuclease YncB( thermonuclease family)